MAPNQRKNSNRPRGAKLVQCNRKGSGPVGIFENLSKSETSSLLSLLAIRECLPGETILAEGQRSEKLFIVLDGVLEVSRTSRRQKAVVLNYVTRGDIVGEVSALTGVPATADVTSFGRCSVGELSAECFNKQISALPQLARFVISSLAQKLSRATDTLFQVATEDVPSRVLHVLQSLRVTEHINSELAFAVCERPTHAELARIVGTSREVVSRALRLLEKSGEIKQTGRRVALKLGTL